MQNPSVFGQPMIGAVYEAGTTPRVGPFNAIFVITPATFSAWSEAGLTGTMTGVAFPAGTWIYGAINSFTLTSGAVRAYKV